MIIFFACIIAGFLFSLGYPSSISSSLGPIFPIFGFIILFVIMENQSSLKRKLISFFIFCSVITLVGFTWITYTMQEFGNLSYYSSAFINSLFIFICLFYFWPFLLLKHYIDKRSPSLRTNSLYPTLMSILACCFELIIPQQFPLYLGHSWLILSPYIKIASVFGVSIFSFLSYLVIFETTYSIKQKRYNPISIFTILITLSICFLFPIKENKIRKRISTRIVQANIGNEQKLSSEGGGDRSYSDILKKYKNLTNLKSTRNPELIIWPETAYSKILYTNAANSIPSDLGQLSISAQANFIIGGYHHNKLSSSSFENLYNSAFHINNGQIKNTYNKEILIPFGETLPLPESINKILSEYLPTMAFFAQGKTKKEFQISPNFNLITPICYEILQSQYIRSYLNNARKPVHAIVNLTNDSWYGDSAEPEQHLFQTKWRAIEFNLPLIRSTNTGISSFILPNGQEASRLNLNQSGVLDYDFPIYERVPTTYQKYGHLPLILIWIILFILTLIKSRIRKHD